MLIPYVIGAVVGVAIGALLAWGISAQRAGKLQAEAAGLSAQLAETRTQTDIARSELERARKDLTAEQTLRTRAETEKENTRASLDEQRRLLADAENTLKDTFDASAAKALERSSQQFLELARASFAGLQKEATGELGKREEAIKGLVTPLADTLKTLQDRLTKDDATRREDYGSLTEQLRQLSTTSEDLRKETGSLVTSLRQPQIKGKWGELLLRRALELAGMSPHCDFTEQQTMEVDDGRRQRPDVYVNLPGGGIIVIDAKVPQGAFLNALSARTQDEYRAAMEEHARLVRTHVTQLSSRKYWEQFPQSPEFVVLFLPAESFFSAALEQDKTLIEDAMDKRVVLASPTTLLALLRAVAHGWRQEQLAENAREISDLGKELYDRVSVFAAYMNNIRTGLEAANHSFNDAVGSLEKRLLPGARKLKEKGIQAVKEIPDLEPTETSLRTLNIPSSTAEE